MSTTRAGSLDAGMRWIEIDRPAQANALDLETMNEMRAAVVAANADPEVEALVIGATGGKHFCGGADRAGPHTPERAKLVRTALGDLLTSLFAVEKPVLVAIGGAAVGAGAMIAMTADCVVMADDAFLSFPELNVGVFPGLAYALVSGRSTRAFAHDVCLSGRRVTAAECRAKSLALEIAPRIDVAARAEAQAAELAGKPRPAFAAFKRHMAPKWAAAIADALGAFEQ